MNTSQSSTAIATTARRSARKPANGMTEAEFNRRYKCVRVGYPPPKIGIHCPGIARRRDQYFGLTVVNVKDPSIRHGYSARFIPSDIPLSPAAALGILIMLDDRENESSTREMPRLYRWFKNNLAKKGGAR